MLTGKSIIHRVLNRSTIEKIFWVVGISLAVVVLAHYGKQQQHQEGFESSKEFVVKRNDEIYDDFYVSIYDDLLYNTVKNDYEVGEIINVAGPTDQSRILDIGSGTGHHVALLSDNGYDAVGIDISPAMILKARENYPKLKFVEGDVQNNMAFEPESFTTITCMYFTIYYMKDKRKFFDNCMKWLMPGGHIMIHLVDRNQFDPIIPAGDPLLMVSPQTYAKERITSSVVEFDTHEYKSNFNLNGPNDATLKETFRNKQNGSIRKNEHHFYMEPQKTILAIAKNAGFILISQTEMIGCQHDDQYIYVLQKPT